MSGPRLWSGCRRHVIFDLDGTLVDTLPGIQWSLRGAVDEVLGPERSCPSVANLIGPPIHKMIAGAFRSETSEQHDKLVAAFRRHYDREGWRRSSLYPGVLATLEALAQQGMTLHVLTNKRLAAATVILDHFGLLPCFRSITAPNPPHLVFATKSEAFARLLQQWDITPDRACMVGDSEDDLMAAKNNDAGFVGVRYGYGRIDELESVRGYAMIHGFEQLLGIL